MALELADDRRARVGGELHLPVDVEAVDRLDEPYGRHLNEVFDRLSTAGEAPGEMLGQSPVLVDQLLTRPRVLPAAVEERSGGLGPGVLFGVGSGPRRFAHSQCRSLRLLANPSCA